VSTTERILVDASHVNGKKQGILNMPEIQVPLTKLLANEKVRARYADGSLKIIVY
jgi:protein CMS1